MRTESFAFGSNLWGIGVADEELFPTKIVLYLGLIAADKPVKVRYDLKHIIGSKANTFPIAEAEPKKRGKD